MKSFDKTSLTDQDYVDLNESMKNAGPRVKLWYSAPNFFGPIAKKGIIEQTGATSDFESLKEKYDWMKEDEYNSREIQVSSRNSLKTLIGFRDLEIAVYNPKNLLPNIKIFGRTADLIQMDALNFGNIYQGRIDFETGTAFFNEEDQDVAHKIGLMYAPGKVLETDALSPSSPSTNKGRIDQGDQIKIYCDNAACKREIRNPILVIDEETGGAYHNHTCFSKDVRLKVYLAKENEDLELKPSPKEISLEAAINMFENNELQQSPSFEEKFPEFRSLNPWPEAAVVLPLR